MDQYTRAAMSSSSPEPPSGTITVGRPALTPMPRIRLWKACWSGSIHLISRWSIMRGARVLPKSSSKAPGMCPPAVASDFAPFSLVNVGALAKVAGSPRTSMMLTSLRCCASHCGLTSGPGRSTALATAVPSSANTMARMLLMPAFMLISRSRPRGALVNKLIEGRQLGRDRHPALADHLHAAVVEQSGAPPAATPGGHAPVTVTQQLADLRREDTQLRVQPPRHRVVGCGRCRGNLFGQGQHPTRRQPGFARDPSIGGEQPERHPARIDADSHQVRVLRHSRRIVAELGEQVKVAVLAGDGPWRSMRVVVVMQDAGPPIERGRRPIVLPDPGGPPRTDGGGQRGLARMHKPVQATDQCISRMACALAAGAVEFAQGCGKAHQREGQLCAVGTGALNLRHYLCSSFLHLGLGAQGLTGPVVQALSAFCVLSALPASLGAQGLVWALVMAAPLADGPAAAGRGASAARARESADSWQPRATGRRVRVCFIIHLLVSKMLPGQSAHVMLGLDRK